MRTSYLANLLFACTLLLSACGGGSSSTTSTTPPVTTSPVTTVKNVQPIVVDNGPSGAQGVINESFVSVTICPPNSTSNCQTIDHILVDTASYGLRIISSALPSSLSQSLTQQTDSSGNSLVECTSFADGYSWGPLKTAGLQISGESVSALTVQIIGAPNFDNIVPRECSGTGLTAENTVATFGANGVLGIGPYASDCGTNCETIADNGVYFSCNVSGTCTSIAVPLAQQMQNPVSLFATDNNGTIVSLPALPNGGALTVSGSLIFGVGTESNNTLGNAQIYPINDKTTYISTIYNSKTYADSFIDSGSNGLFFTDNSIPQCTSGFYCPATTLNLSASQTTSNGSQGAISFSIGDSSSFFDNNSADAAYAWLGGINSDPSSFDWGLPFFYGRNVYTVIENATVGGATGPYYAY